MTVRKGKKLIGLVVKNHIDQRPIRPDIKKCIKVLKAMAMKEGLKVIGVVRDPAMMKHEEWGYFVDTVNKIFKNATMAIFLFRNSLSIPAVGVRYKLIREYHESAAGGHKGITKTYARLSRDYYWRNIKADVYHFVRGCQDCQKEKLVRTGTKLPMIITDTPSKPFIKVAMDFVGPKTVTETGHKWILTIQCVFSKFCVLVPTREATAKEVARGLTDRLICNFGTPEIIFSDQGKHFMNTILKEFALLFKIDKFATTAYRPQSNGSIERMHHSLLEYLKMFQEAANRWDLLLPLAQHSYNTQKHEGLNYSPHEIVFLARARTPSSFPPRDHMRTYDDYLAETTSALAQLRTIAAMNLGQAKYRAKERYDRTHNAQHFRVGEMVYLLKKREMVKTIVNTLGHAKSWKSIPKTTTSNFVEGTKTRWYMQIILNMHTIFRDPTYQRLNTKKM